MTLIDTFQEDLFDKSKLYCEQRYAGQHQTFTQHTQFYIAAFNIDVGGTLCMLVSVAFGVPVIILLVISNVVEDMFLVEFPSGPIVYPF